MSIATRAATCTACGKRLNRKRWYYRNGKYFCKKRCWMTEQEKAAKDAAKPAPAAEAKPMPAAEAKPTPAAAGPASGGASDALPPPATPEQPASS